MTLCLFGVAKPIPRDPKDNGVAAIDLDMLMVLTRGANEKPFVYDQHGGDDVTCKPRIS